MMGLTTLAIQVGNPANPDVTEELEFLIDSGAINSEVPTSVAVDSGMRSLENQHAFNWRSCA